MDQNDHNLTEKVSLDGNKFPSDCLDAVNKTLSWRPLTLPHYYDDYFIIQYMFIGSRHSWVNFWWIQDYIKYVCVCVFPFA